ncbi:hypothetical protein ACN47E_006003 [Coniothyrium glycines]
MALLITPRFLPAYEQEPHCNPFALFAQIPPAAYSRRICRPQRHNAQFSSFNHFFSHVDKLLADINRQTRRQEQLEAHLEERRETHRQRQHQKHAIPVVFTVNQTGEGWQVAGDIDGFKQDQIKIEVDDERTLRISGNTLWQAETSSTPKTKATTAVDQISQDKQPQVEASVEHVDSATTNDPEAEPSSNAEPGTVSSAISNSDTESHKSYQATVEDDFEDLGTAISSIISISSDNSPLTKSNESIDKQRTVEKPLVTDSMIAPQMTPAPHIQKTLPEQEKREEQQRFHRSFERVFNFPERIQVDNVSAKFEGGILKVAIPRVHAAQFKRVVIL